MGITATYNDDIIASSNDINNTLVLKTKEKYLTDDITVITSIPNNYTNTSDATLTSNDQMLAGIIAYSNGTKYTGTIASKTSSDMTIDTTPLLEVNITAPAGYYASDGVMSLTKVLHATPTISVSSSGLITASHTMSTEGYFSATGTSTKTQQLTTKAATTYNTSTSDQTIAAGTYLTGAQTIRKVTTTNLTAANIKNGVNVKVGDAGSSGRIANITGTCPGFTLLASTELTVNTTSTSAASAGTVSAGTDAWTKDKIIYVRIRDKAGKRAGYFYGSDAYFINFQAANESTTTLTQAAKLIHRYSSSNAWTTYCTGTTAGYGVYGYSITSDGTVNIYHRYNSTYSLTIDGTYTVEVYSLDFPDLISPFV